MLPLLQQSEAANLLAREDDLEEVVRAFLTDLPQRASQLSLCARSSDWTAVRHSAHQLRGTAGSFGFPKLMRAAENLERCAAEDAAPADRQGALATLIDVCNGMVQPLANPPTCSSGP